MKVARVTAKREDAHLLTLD